VQTLKNDDDLSSLRGDPRFEKILLASGRNARPGALDDTPVGVGIVLPPVWVKE